jgi:hypothetical protein
VNRTLCKVFLIICLFLGVAFQGLSQSQTSSLKGKIIDTEGLPLPGAFIYISSPAMMEIKTYITAHTGNFRFTLLPPGTYSLTVEMPGFKTVNIEDIKVGMGKTTTITVTMEITKIEEEITLDIPSPTLDAESAKTAVILEQEIIKNIPLSRDLHHIINSDARIHLEGTPYQPEVIVHGSSARANTYAWDGLSENDPWGRLLITNINFDVIEEIELETAGHPPAIESTEGGYINVVPKSGGNSFVGKILLSHKSDSLTQSLLSERELDDPEILPPLADQKMWDISLSLGGSLLENRLWYFGNGRLISHDRTTDFNPWIDPMGKSHEDYLWSDNEKLGFFKLSSKITSQISFSVMFNYTNRHQPIYDSSLGWNITEEATRVWDHEKNYNLDGRASYVLNQNTFIEWKASYLSRSLPLYINQEAGESPQYFDQATGYLWGSAPFNEKRLTKRFQVGAYFTRFQDDFVRGNHQLKLGAEYEYVNGEQDTWKNDNLLIDYFDGSPYYFGLDSSPATGSTVGKGMIHFYLASMQEDGLNSIAELRKLGFFIQERVTFADRLTLNFGIRFDHSDTRMPAFQKLASGNPLSLQLGEELIKPEYDVNPYDENIVSEMKSLMTWNSWSPRVGMNLNVYGNGKTVLKASFARYNEYMMLDYLMPLNPFFPGRSHRFFWYDEDMNGQPDDTDTYLLDYEDYRLYLEDYYRKRIDPDIKSPYTQEWTIGLSQEIFRDFSVGVNYIHKSKDNILENVLYSPDTDSDWYTRDQDSEGWWIPFHTVVPGNHEYQDTPVTVYFWSQNAPLSFNRLKNVPELKRKYEALELAVKKRWSHNWQFLGSLVWSKSTGNMPLGYEANSGFTEAADSPNYFVNYSSEESRLDYDRPLIFKLMGTYRFQFGLLLSFYYTHMSGRPWARSVTIYPPATWIEDNHAYGSFARVYLESPGTRRYDSYNNLDLRVEKELRLGGSTKISAYVDILNALGSKYKIAQQNDGGFWFPDDENTPQGRRVLSPDYDTTTYILGSRIFMLGFRFSF